jgi:hypothetical protein
VSNGNDSIFQYETLGMIWKQMGQNICELFDLLLENVFTDISEGYGRCKGSLHFRNLLFM